MSATSILKYGIVSQGAEAFSPSDLSGLQAWYGDLVNSGTNRSTLSNGASITQWDDQSGNSYHMGDKSGTVTYNSSNDWIDLTSGTLYDTDHPVITGSTNRTVFSVNAVGATGYIMFLGRYTVSAGDYYAPNVLSTSTFRLDTDASYRDFSMSTISTDTVYLWTNYNTGTTTSTIGARRNGSNLSVSSTNSNTLDTNEGIITGGYINGFNPVNSGSPKMQELIIYNRKLNATEIGQVETWLNDKYSIY